MHFLLQLFLAGGFVSGGSASPLTTKGDLYTYSTANTRLGVGSDGLCLKADSAQATGLLWDTCAAGGSGLTQPQVMARQSVGF